MARIDKTISAVGGSVSESNNNVRNCGDTFNEANFTLVVKLNSQSTEDNTSNITCTYTMKVLGSGDQWSGQNYPCVGTLYVAGDNKDDSDVRTGTGGTTYTLGSWTGDVEHDSEGKLTIDIDGKWTVDSASSRHWPPEPNNIELAVKLPTIDREGKLSSDKSILTSTDSTVTITITPYINTFKYKIDRKVGTKGWEESWKSFGSGGTDSDNFTDTYNDIITRAGEEGSYSVQYKCTTYGTDGTTQIGTEDILVISTYYAGEPMPMSLYQNGSSIGVSFLTEINQPGFWVAGQGPITMSTQAFTLDDGNSYYILGKWD